MQVLRSVLFMPGSNVRALEKARTLDADAVIFDLEDAVSPNAKHQARENVVAALTEGGYKNRVVVRINGLGTPWWQDDIKALADLSFSGIVLPKPSSAEDVLTCIKLIQKVGLPDVLPLWLMAETPECVANCEEIFSAHPRVKVVVMGTSDLSKELRLPNDPERQGLQYALGRCLNAARVCGLDIIDGVFGELHDDEGFARQCEQGRALGFDGKSLIHPNQISEANACFAPTPQQLEDSAQIVEAWRAAEKAGSGIVVVNGRMIEALHVQQALRVLAMADFIQRRES
jgi:citrate lyase subunit beta / citryl-CoA lyase